MKTDSWNPSLYDKFKRERSQPYFDLIALLTSTISPKVIDLGCGTGELTAALHTKTAARSTLGIDNSERMLQSAAQYKTATLHFETGDIQNWNPSEKYDIIFSNAAIQWCENHPALLKKFRQALTANGQLAIQMPMNFDYFTHTLANRMSHESPWKEHLEEVYDKSAVMLDPSIYATLLFDLGFKEQRVYTNVYGHILPSRDHVIEWVQGTTLTHFQSRLSKELYAEFIEQYKKRLFEKIPDTQPFFFPFKRLFIWGKL